MAARLGLRPGPINFERRISQNSLFSRLTSNGSNTVCSEPNSPRKLLESAIPSSTLARMISPFHDEVNEPSSSPMAFNGKVDGATFGLPRSLSGELQPASPLSPLRANPRLWDNMVLTKDRSSSCDLHQTMREISHVTARFEFGVFKETCTKASLHDELRSVRIPFLDRKKIERHALTGFEIGMTRARMIIGAAIFAVPMFMISSGWIGLVVILIGSGAMLYTGMLLGSCLDVLKEEGSLEEPSYGDIGTRLVGPAFAPIFTAFCVAECFVVVIFLLVFVANAVGIHLGIACSVLI